MESFVDREIQSLMPRIIKAPMKLDEDAMAKGIQEYSAKIQDITNKEHRRPCKQKNRKKPITFKGSGREMKTIKFDLQVNRELDPRKDKRKSSGVRDTERVRQDSSAETPAQLNLHCTYTLRQRNSKDLKRFNGSGRRVFYRPLILRTNDSLRPCNEAENHLKEPTPIKEGDANPVLEPSGQDQIVAGSKAQNYSDSFADTPADQQAGKNQEEIHGNDASIETGQEVAVDLTFHHPLLADLKEAKQEYLDLKNQNRNQEANCRPFLDLQPRSGILRLILDDDNENVTSSDTASTETIIDNGDKGGSQTADHDECVKGAETLSALKGVAPDEQGGEDANLCNENSPSRSKIEDIPEAAQDDYEQGDEDAANLGCPSMEPKSRSEDSESDDGAEPSIDQSDMHFHLDEDAQAAKDDSQNADSVTEVKAAAKPRRKKRDISGRKSLAGLPTVADVELTEIKSPDWRPVKRTKSRRVQACRVKAEAT